MREIERIILLRNVDLKWMDHLENMEDLKGSIGLQAYAQRGPINQYRIQGADMFDEMSEMIRADTVRGVLSVLPRPHVEIKREEVARVTGEGFEGNTPAKTGTAAYRFGAQTGPSCWCKTVRPGNKTACISNDKSTDGIGTGKKSRKK